MINFKKIIQSLLHAIKRGKKQHDHERVELFPRADVSPTKKSRPHQKGGLQISFMVLLTNTVSALDRAGWFASGNGG
jgi:hypothetical protein